MKYTSNPGLKADFKTSIPNLVPPSVAPDESGRLDFDEYSVDIYEWLSLIRLGSPRVAAGDEVDQYISSYTIPGPPEEAPSSALCMMTWEGFMPPSWTQRLLAVVVLAIPSKQWFALSATTFAKGVIAEASECTIMRPPNSPGEYFLWDVHGHS